MKIRKALSLVSTSRERVEETREIHLCALYNLARVVESQSLT